MNTHDEDRLWTALDRLTEISTDNAKSIAGLAETTKAHAERIARLEGSPTSLRGWIVIVLQAGGCLAMMLAALVSIASIVIAAMALHP